MNYFDDNIKIAVWNKGKIVPGNDPTQTRQDECTAWIKYQDYGNRDSDYGWEIDHIVPQDRGGTDDISNLRPLHWKNNATKQDGRLVCAVKARI